MCTRFHAPIRCLACFFFNVVSPVGLFHGLVLILFDLKLLQNKILSSSSVPSVSARPCRLGLKVGQQYIRTSSNFTSTAPEKLLNTIFCNCKKGCNAKYGRSKNTNITSSVPMHLSVLDAISTYTLWALYIKSITYVSARFNSGFFSYGILFMWFLAKKKCT